MQVAVGAGAALILAFIGQAVRTYRLQLQVQSLERELSECRSNVDSLMKSNASLEKAVAEKQKSVDSITAYCRDREAQLVRRIEWYSKLLNRRPPSVPTHAGGRSCGGDDDVTRQLNCLLSSQTDGCRP